MQTPSQWKKTAYTITIPNTRTNTKRKTSLVPRHLDSSNMATHSRLHLIQSKHLYMFMHIFPPCLACRGRECRKLLGWHYLNRARDLDVKKGQSLAQADNYCIHTRLIKLDQPGGLTWSDRMITIRDLGYIRALNVALLEYDCEEHCRSIRSGTVFFKAVNCYTETRLIHKLIHKLVNGPMPSRECKISEGSGGQNILPWVVNICNRPRL